MSHKKSLSIYEEEILMKQIKAKEHDKELDVNRNAWSKVAEIMDFIQNGVYKYGYEKLVVHLQ